MSAQRESSESPESASVSVATNQACPNSSEISTGEQTTSAGGSAKETASGSQGGVARSPMGVPVVVVNGERFLQLPVSVSTEEHLRNLKNMPMREDDVIVAAYAKSGQSMVVVLAVVVVLVVVVMVVLLMVVVIVVVVGVVMMVMVVTVVVVVMIVVVVVVVVMVIVVVVVVV